MLGKKLVAFLSVLMLLTLTVMPLAHAASNIWYVYTENGKTLNVRSSPVVSNGTLVGRLPYGAKVEVLYFEGNWACIYYHWDDGLLSGDECWVQKRFLVAYQPAPHSSSYVPSGSGSSSGGSSSGSSTSKAATNYGQLGELNREFKTLQLVTPFVVSSKPVRSSGFVNLRWAPHAEAEIAGIAYYGHRLTVIASTANWYQVEDEATGKICFVMKKYTMR